MTVMVLLAFTMRQVRISPEVVGRAASGRYAGCGIAAERVARVILPQAAINSSAYSASLRLCDKNSDKKVINSILQLQL